MQILRKLKETGIIQAAVRTINPKGDVTMEKKQKNSQQKAQALQDPLMNSGSAGDCTGLIPAMPDSGEEYENYAGLYDYLPPERQNTEQDE